MGYKIWILSTLLVGTFAPGLPKPMDESELDYYLTSRIIGGDPAGKVPYMVALTNGVPVHEFVCGGSLVTTRTILTAAHCIQSVTSEGVLSSSLLATVGTNIWNVSGDNYKIAKSIVHPHANINNISNDIGILITVEKVRLSKSVGTVSLSYDFIGGDIETRVTGWGITELDSDDIPNSLQQLTAETVDGGRCVAEVAQVAKQLDWTIQAVNRETELCTFHSLHHGTCFGDSGSPLVLAESGLQVGIVSWGLPCALGAPDMFVRISAFRDWLQQNIIH